ncbi:Spy0128 family protein [Staphylococcus haemolyticus]|uniref:Spy0128 family protein n=2 Tax=Staphylococcus TaxID=1279 RepID=UPI0031197F18
MHLRKDIKLCNKKTKYRFSIRKFSIGTVSILLDAFLFMDFQDVAHASELHNSTSTTDTASNQQSFEKKVNNSTHEDVQNAASPSQSIPLKNLENTTKLNPNFDAEPLTITATVIVTEGNGILNANVSYAYDSDDDNNQAFTNYYVTPKQLDFDVHFTKSLVGRPLNNGEFQFTMKNADSEVIATGTNNATGQINFNFIEGKRPTYTNADAGKTFTYTVEEVPSNLPNINSDAMKAIVTVNVTKDLHVLTATSIVPADTEFNNTVEPPVPPTPNKPPHNPPKTPGQPPVNPPGNPPEKPGVPPIHHVPPTPKQPNQPKHLPNTGSDDANMNKSLLATMFAGLGSVL